MKHFKFMTIIVSTAVCFYMLACSEQKPAIEEAARGKAKVESLATTPEDIKKEARDLIKTTMAYSEEQKELYQKQMQEKMARYSQKLMELEAKLAMLNEQAKADLTAEMEDLSRKKAEMGPKIRELQAASGDAYEDLKKGMDKAMEEVDKAYEQAMNRFEK